MANSFENPSMFAHFQILAALVWSLHFDLSDKESSLQLGRANQCVIHIIMSIHGCTKLEIKGAIRNAIAPVLLGYGIDPAQQMLVQLLSDESE